MCHFGQLRSFASKLQLPLESIVIVMKSKFASRICCVLLAVQGAVAHGTALVQEMPKRHDVSTLFFLETCATVGETAYGMIPHFDCQSYMYGVLDGHIAVRNLLPKGQRACFPVSLSPAEALKAIDASLFNDDSKRAAPAILNALRKKYPCV